MTLLYDLHGQGHSVHCLLCDYKQQHVQELTFAKTHCHRLGVLFTTVELPALRGLEAPDYVVPFRNPIMLAIAVNLAVIAKADTITIGCNKDDREQFKDCRWEVLDAMNHAIKLSGYEIEICAPYLNEPKWKIAGMAREMGVPLHEIWSCYRGGVKPCGECPACLKLNAALK